MKKTVIALLAVPLFFLGGCSGGSVKTQPSVNLPYEIANNEVQEYKDKGLENYIEYQVLENVTVRDLTTDENEEFLKKIKDNTLNTLNSEYSAIEFDFGDIKRISNGKAILQFDKDTTYFVYDDKILDHSFYQIKEYSHRKLFKTFNDKKGEEISYGEERSDFKIISLVKKGFIKKGLQLKTTINDEVVYIDIE